MITKSTFSKALNLMLEHNAQLRRLMDVTNTIGANLMLISTESFYHDAICLVFRASFLDAEDLLCWWLYDSPDHELFLGEQVFNATDPGDFYDFMVKYRQDWKEQRQCNAQPQTPVMISKECFCKAIALIRKEQASLQQAADTARQCGAVFSIHANTSKYLDALILLLQDIFGDHKGLLRWYITKPVDHKVFIGDAMYDLNDPGALYDFMLAHTTELKGEQ